MSSFSDLQMAEFAENGFLRLGKIIDDAELAALNARLDDIMLGKVQYGEKLLMQVDPNAPPILTTASSPSSSAAASGGGGSASVTVPSTAADEYDAYSKANVEVNGQTVGFKGPTLAYRKIGEAEAGLECDPLFLSLMQKPLFRAICDRVYGAHAAIAVYRAMVMSKPAGDLGGGTPLPWHQDGGDVSY
jgi:phytanoyl-CoA hydroxylase